MIDKLFSMFNRLNKTKEVPSAYAHEQSKGDDRTVYMHTHTHTQKTKKSIPFPNSEKRSKRNGLDEECIYKREERDQGEKN